MGGLDGDAGDWRYPKITWHVGGGSATGGRGGASWVAFLIMEYSVSFVVGGGRASL